MGVGKRISGGLESAGWAAAGAGRLGAPGARPTVGGVKVSATKPRSINSATFRSRLRESGLSIMTTMTRWPWRSAVAARQEPAQMRTAVVCHQLADNRYGREQQRRDRVAPIGGGRGKFTR